MARKPVKPVKAEKLKKKELEEFKKRLLHMKDELMKELKTNEEAGREATAHEEGVRDLADQAADSYDRDIAYGISKAERARVLEINKALERIEAGTYGICRISKDPIPKTRLEALPFATVTVEVQAQIENGEIEDPDPK